MMHLLGRDIRQPDFGGNCHLFCFSSPPGSSPLLAAWGEIKAGLLVLCVELLHLLHNLCTVQPPVVVVQIRQGQLEPLPWRQGYTRG